MAILARHAMAIAMTASGQTLMPHPRRADESDFAFPVVNDAVDAVLALAPVAVTGVDKATPCSPVPPDTENNGE
jgi:hypothetical protein